MSLYKYETGLPPLFCLYVFNMQGVSYRSSLAFWPIPGFNPHRVIERYQRYQMRFLGHQRGGFITDHIHTCGIFDCRKIVSVERRTTHCSVILYLCIALFGPYRKDNLSIRIGITFLVNLPPEPDGFHYHSLWTPQ